MVITLKVETFLLCFEISNLFLSHSESQGIMAAKAKEKGCVTIKNGRKGKNHVANPILVHSQTSPKPSSSSSPSPSSSLSSQMKILCSLPPTLSYFHFSLFMQDPKNDSNSRYVMYISSLTSTHSHTLFYFAY